MQNPFKRLSKEEKARIKESINPSTRQANESEIGHKTKTKEDMNTLAESSLRLADALSEEKKERMKNTLTRHISFVSDTEKQRNWKESWIGFIADGSWGKNMLEKVGEEKFGKFIGSSLDSAHKAMASDELGTEVREIANYLSDKEAVFEKEINE